LGALPVIRFFCLSEDGARCGADGLHIGAAPLLCRAASGGWAVRPRDEAETELTALYGLPIDLSGKVGGLATVAAALDRGDAALAAIAAVLLGFPDPPGLAKDAPARGSAELAAQLIARGLLRDWDSAKHPRVGDKPNPGWFAAKPVDPNAPPPAVPAEPSLVREFLRAARVEARALLKGAAKKAVADGRLALWAIPDLKLLVETLVEVLDPTPLNGGEQQVLDQIRAADDPPKTLEELQQPPEENVLGYQRHHIVEQNPDNVAKSPLVAAIEKFGRAALDDPSNIVWVPTFKHEQITGYYNALERSDQPEILHRDVVDELDFAAQRAAGLDALCKFGVLK
jgi:hypothetical protein